MGIASDFYERAEESYWAFVGSQTRASWRPQVITPTFACGFCPLVYPRIEDLQQHLFNAHKPVAAFVRVNGQVALGEVVPVAEWVRSLEIVPLGARTVHVQIRLPGDGREYPFVSEHGETLDVTRLFDLADVEGEVTVTTTTEAGTSCTTLEVRSLPEIDFATLDETIFECQEPLLRNRESQWRRLQALRTHHDLERRYCDAFAEYLLGSDLEARGDWGAASRLFERSFTLLAPYRTPLARDARSILAFRMHAFAFLSTLGDRSIYWPSVAFFQSPAKSVASTRDTARAQRPGIWIDDFQEATLAAVSALQRGEHESARSLMLSAPANLSREPGNALKRDVVLARALATIDATAARAYYFRLVTNETYAREARAFTGD